MAFELPPLPYGYDDLAPYIGGDTMRFHHDKHHAGYTNNLNAAIEKHPELAEVSAEDLLRNLASVPEDIRTAVRNNGGGYVNHSLFWEVMSPQGGGAPTGALAAALDAAFGGFEEFKSLFSKAAATRFGSGWAWLAFDAFGNLVVYSTPNQDSPYLSNHNPILGLDVWEHAYYLNYQNRRPDYIAAFWNVVNWEAVTAKFTALAR
ncbi:MAG: superoxide dismutase [Chloroflexi bacterium]|nr:superoxide dismutase [Chloroflexota bacterium]